MTRTFALFLLALPLGLTGCKKEVPPVAPPMSQAVPPPPPSAPAPLPPPPPAALPALLKVSFALDSASLDAEARATLKRDAEILRDHPEIRVEIQGHCDERGTTEYNLALGDRRATAVRKALASEGIASSRLTTISFGEERPASGGSDEGAWAANRRAELRVTSGDGVLGTVR